MTKICVLTESELLHRHQLKAEPGYYVVEEGDADDGARRYMGKEPAVKIREGPIDTEPQALHIAETRFGMEVF